MIAGAHPADGHPAGIADDDARLALHRLLQLRWTRLRDRARPSRSPPRAFRCRWTCRRFIATVLEIVGLYVPKFDRLAYRIAETITVNKSLAVVLGIGPLLMINLLYTSQFYAANALTGHAWALLIPLVSIAFLLTYLHKYTWHTWTGERKVRHIAVGAAASLLFMGIPLIFLTNINLMLFPEKWSEVSGFLSSLRIGNVFPRYFHFMAASLAIMGLFLSGRFGWRRVKVDEDLPGFTRGGLRRHFYKWTFFVTLAQFAFGPLLLLTLPTQGITPLMLALILGGAALGVLTLVLLRAEIKAPDERVGRFFPDHRVDLFHHRDLHGPGSPPLPGSLPRDSKNADREQDRRVPRHRAGNRHAHPRRARFRRSAHRAALRQNNLQPHLRRLPRRGDTHRSAGSRGNLQTLQGQPRRDRHLGQGAG